MPKTFRQVLIVMTISKTQAFQNQKLYTFTVYDKTITMTNPNGVEFTKEEYDRLRDLIEGIKHDLGELETLVRVEASEEIELKYKVLLGIHEEGGIVTKARFDEIGEELGYDKRGLQGFFAWGGRFVTRIAGDKVALTQAGINRLKRLGLI